MAENLTRKRAPKNGLDGAAGTRKVTFECRRPAREVFLAGTFNNWNPNVTPMILIGDDLWMKELWLPPGTYEYLFVADGKWLPDPRARASAPNPYGGVNSVVKVG